MTVFPQKGGDENTDRNESLKFLFTTWPADQSRHFSARVLGARLRRCEAMGARLGF
ncbi:hypothetical protein [Pseudomonas orientalis]|jgi:hypothetical protein|uniref:hypothetical protein n=1 Tax=Pseudomonas orientalis TaxID=76758 RepID=UPI0013EE993A|nr:hypothetical protein [Pseudomonas orientalis]